MHYTQALRSLFRSLALSVVACAVLAVCQGCKEPENEVVVKGTVSFRGKLLDHGSLRFFSESPRPLAAVINEDGTYEAKLPLGDYQVTVSSPPLRRNADPEDDTPPPPDPNALPSRFSQVNSSGLELKVEKLGEPITWNLDLQ